MAGTARRLQSLPLLEHFEQPDDLHRAIRNLSRASAVGRPRSVTEVQALHELERAPVAMSLEAWEGLAREAHAKYRAKGAPYRDVEPEVLALACNVRLAYVHGLWQSSFNPVSCVAQVAPRADRHAQAFDSFHETAESLCVGQGGTHADAQWVTVALMVERTTARDVLRAHGLRSGVTALARSHRRIRRCFLWVRLAMVAASAR